MEPDDGLFAPGPSRTGLCACRAPADPTFSRRLIRPPEKTSTGGPLSARWPALRLHGVTGPCCGIHTVGDQTARRSHARVTLFRPSHRCHTPRSLTSLTMRLDARPSRETRPASLGLLLPGVHKEVSRYVGASASENGTLVCGQSGAEVSRQLTWSTTAASGHERPQPILGLALSRTNAGGGDVGNGAPNNVDIWLIDIARTILSRLTVHPDGRSPLGRRHAGSRSNLTIPTADRRASNAEHGDRRG